MGGSFSNFFSTCIRQQIQLYTSWSESRQHKFTAYCIFRWERSSTAVKFFDEFTPYSLFSLNYREQQSLKTSISCEYLQDYKNDVFSAPWLRLKSVILLEGDVSSKKSRHFLPAATSIKVPSKKMFPLQ